MIVGLKQIQELRVIREENNPTPEATTYWRIFKGRQKISGLKRRIPVQNPVQGKFIYHKTLKLSNPVQGKFISQSFEAFKSGLKFWFKKN